MVIKRIRRAFSERGSIGDTNNEYIEIDTEAEESVNKVAVKVFELKSYDDVNRILNALREGNTIALIDIKNLKQKDSIELKRSVTKIKKTVDAMNGKVAGHNNIVIATPAFARIYRDEPAQQKQDTSDKFDTY
ncbi:MAG: cell division protein SepF [bacterium]